jgi:hypothetical protein
MRECLSILTLRFILKHFLEDDFIEAPLTAGLNVWIILWTSTKQLG